MGEMEGALEMEGANFLKMLNEYDIYTIFIRTFASTNQVDALTITK